jgi:hypothetical protein
MSVDDLFLWEGGRLEPVLRPLQVPVRAVVMPLMDEAMAR